VTVAVPGRGELGGFRVNVGFRLGQESAVNALNGRFLAEAGDGVAIRAVTRQLELDGVIAFAVLREARLLIRA